MASVNCETHSHAIVISENSIERIHRVLRERVGNVTITVKCTDGLDRPMENAVSLVQFDNATSRAIREITMEARGSEPHRRASVRLSSIAWTPPATISVDGCEAFVRSLRDDLHDMLRSARPWYHLLTRVDFMVAVVLVYAVAWVVLLMLVGFVWRPPPTSQGSNPTANALAQLIFIGSIIFLIIVGLLLNRVRQWLFPKVVFLIGDEHERHERRKEVQRVLLYVIVAPVAWDIVKWLIRSVT